MASAAKATLELTITGLKDPALSNVKQRLAILQEDYGNTHTADAIRAFVDAAPNHIQEALQPFGFFHSRITTHLGHHDEHWVAHFDIQKGIPLRISKIQVHIIGVGESEPALQELVTHFPLEKGQIFRADKYEEAKKRLFQTANNLGYIKATLIMKEVRVNLSENTAMITLKLDTGPQYYFGDIQFQQTTFSQEFLDRFLPFKTGDTFSTEKLLTLQQNLNESHYFQQIAVTPEMEQESANHIPVNVLLKATKSQHYHVALGYGTYTGPRLTLGANLRHITADGHRMNFQVKLSPVLSGVAAQYVIPGKNPLTDAYTFGANFQKFSPKNGYSNSKNISASYTTKIHHWKTTGALTYLHENYFIDGQKSSHNSRLLIPSLSLIKVVADDKISPRFGHKIDFVIRGASTSFISNSTFIQSEIKAKYIHSFSYRNSLVLGGDFGYTAVRNIRSLPLSLQFFAGGMNSVRGFPYTYFGPGRYLKVGSVEWRHRFFDQWSGAVFYDVGMADDHINAPMGHGTGVGVIYDSAIGPIRVYTGIGHLKDKPNHFDLEFSIGPEL